MRTKQVTLFFGFLFFFSTNLCSQTLFHPKTFVIGNSQTEHKIPQDFLKVYKTKTNTTLKDLQKNPQEYLVNSSKLDRLSTYWFHFRLKQENTKISEYILNISGGGQQHHVYVLLEDSLIYQTQTGSMIAKKDKDFKDVISAVKLNLAHEKTIDIFIKSTDLNGSFPPLRLSLHKTLDFYQDRYYPNLICGIIICTIVTFIFLFNFIIYTFTKDKSSLILVLSMFIIIVFNYNIYNIFYHFTNIGDYPQIGFYLNYLLIIYQLLYLWFLYSYINPRNSYPTLLVFRIWFVCLLFLSSLTVFFIVIKDLSETRTISLFRVSVNLLLSILLTIYIPKTKQNLFVVIGSFVFFSFGIVLFIIEKHIPILLLSYITPLGFIVKVIILSIGIGYKIKQNEEEKNKAQIQVLHKSRENEKLIKEQNKVLAEKVNEKTRDLQEKNEEIQVAYEEMAQMNEELQQTQEELMSQRDLLQENNYTLELFRTKITSSIRSAYTIQQAILPPKAKLDEILGEYFIINRPKDQVSGDFYWVNQINNKKFLIVADCTGHGVSGAFMTMIGNTLLDKIIKVWDIYDPAQILETVHTEIQAVLQQAETDNTDGMDVAVAVLEESENPQGFRVEFAGAKRPMYYSETGKNEIEKLSGVRKMVGGFTNPEKRYVTEKVILPKGSMIYMASDGYSDQNDQNRSSFSERRFMGMLSIIQEKTLSEQKSFLEEALDAHIAGTEQRDDILVVGMRV